MRWLTRALVLLVVVLVVSAGWLTFRALQVRDALTSAASESTTLGAQLARGDLAGATATQARLSAQTAKADTASHDPVWRLAGYLPGLGENFRAVSTVSNAARDACDQAVGPLLAAGRKAGVAAGSVDLRALAALLPAARSAAVVLARDTARVNAIDTAALLPPVRTGVTRVQAALNAVDRPLQALTALPGG